MFNNKSIIDVAYSDGPGRCLNFVARFSKYELGELYKSLRRSVPDYNDFDASAFIRELEQIQDDVFTIEFGREYSPVAYITFDRKITKRRALQISEIFTGVSERSVSKHFTWNKCWTVRLWWD